MHLLRFHNFEVFGLTPYQKPTMIFRYQFHPREWLKISPANALNTTIKDKLGKLLSPFIDIGLKNLKFKLLILFQKLSNTVIIANSFIPIEILLMINTLEHKLVMWRVSSNNNFKILKNASTNRTNHLICSTYRR